MMIEVKRYRAMDGKEFITEEDALKYEKLIIPHYEKTLRFKCILHCENFTVGQEYPLTFKYLGFNKQGLVITKNDHGDEISLGETWLEGVIKNRFEVIILNAL